MKVKSQLSWTQIVLTVQTAAAVLAISKLLEVLLCWTWLNCYRECANHPFSPWEFVLCCFLSSRFVSENYLKLAVSCSLAADEESVAVNVFSAHLCPLTMSLSVLFITAAKTLLNKKADVKVRVIALFTSAPLFFSPRLPSQLLKLLPSQFCSPESSLLIGLSYSWSFIVSVVFHSCNCAGRKYPLEHVESSVEHVTICQPFPPAVIITSSPHSPLHSYYLSPLTPSGL